MPVLVQPLAAMTAHCQTHPNESVHGILLLGRCETASSSEVVVVTEAPPVVEAVLGLVMQNHDKTTIVVGWYMAPMLLEDTRPGPVALRMVANLMSTGPGTGGAGENKDFIEACEYLRVSFRSSLRSLPFWRGAPDCQSPHRHHPVIVIVIAAVSSPTGTRAGRARIVLE